MGKRFESTGLIEKHIEGNWVVISELSEDLVMEYSELFYSMMNNAETNPDDLSQEVKDTFSNPPFDYTDWDCDTCYSFKGTNNTRLLLKFD